MRLRPRFWIGGKLPVVDTTGKDPAWLYYCGFRWIVMWHDRCGLNYWRVKGIASSLRLGRLQIQHVIRTSTSGEPGYLMKKKEV